MTFVIGRGRYARASYPTRSEAHSSGPSATVGPFATTAALGAYNASGDASGTIAFVRTPGDGYEYVSAPSAALLAAADNVNVVTATPVGGVWVRLGWLNEAAWYETAWWVDPVAGSDAATGTSSGTPLRSLTELGRRLRGARIAQDVTVTVRAGTTEFGNWDVEIAAGIIFLIVGSSVATLSTTLSNVVASNPSANVLQSITVASGTVAYRDGLRIIRSGAVAGIARSVSTATGATVDTCRFVAPDALGASPVYITPVIGDDVQIYTLTTAVSGVRARVSGSGVLCVRDCIVTGNGVITVPTPTMFVFDGCDYRQATRNSANVIHACWMSGSNLFVTGGQLWARGCVVTALLSVGDAWLSFVGGVIDNGSISVQRNGFFDGSGNLLVVNTAAAAIAALLGGRAIVGSYNPIYGLNNTAEILRVYGGSYAQYGTLAFWVVTTSAAQPLILGGTPTALASLPAGSATQGWAMGTGT